MAGELIEVKGVSAFSSYGTCPSSLKGKKVTLKPTDGGAIELDAKAACLSRKLCQLVQEQSFDPIDVPLKKASLTKIVEYLKYHADTPPSEIRIPLVNDNLVECGCSKWDVNFVNVEQPLLLELMVAATLLDIPSLVYLTGAKAALTIKDKEPAKLVKDFKMTGDLGDSELETLEAAFKSQRQSMNLDADDSSLAGIALLVNGLVQTAERNDALASTHGDDPGPSSVNLRSYRHATWRALVLADWNQLADAPGDVRNDKDLVYAAILSSRGMALKYAGDQLRRDKKLVLTAAKLNGTTLEYADSTLRGDRDFVMEAIMLNGASLCGASDLLRGNGEFIINACKNGRGAAMQGATDALKKDSAFVLDCAKRDPEAFKYAHDALRNDRSICVEAAKLNGSILQYMTPAFRADQEIVQLATNNDAASAAYAHTSARCALNLPAPWDSNVSMDAAVKAQGQGEPKQMPLGRRIVGVPPSQGDAEAQGIMGTIRHMKMEKSVQFSAMSTMAGNVGQAGYVAANSWLDKIVYYERPEIDAVTLMWGAVGGMGMRWKAFGDKDFLASNPDALMGILDASKVLHMTTTMMNPPEWYAACFFDEWTRNAMLSPTAGMVKAETIQARNSSGGDSEKENQRKEDDRKVPLKASPLGGWPTLRNWSEPQKGAVSQPSPPHFAEDLAEGYRVELVGLQSKSGSTGTLIKCCTDGKWKVRLDDGSGNALLKPHNLARLSPHDRSPAQPTQVLDALPRRAFVAEPAD